MKWTIAVLAAGKGTRMMSDLPKVLHEAAGRSLLDHVLDLAQDITDVEDIVVVVGHGAEEVESHIRSRGVKTVLQEPQLGTGDALRVALEAKSNEGDSAVMVLSGDVPLLRPASLVSLRERLEEGAHAALLTAVLDDPNAYGRIIRGHDRGVQAIVEAKDADAETLALNEVNAGVYAFRRASLEQALASLKPDNTQGEYYLTDVVAWLRKAGFRVTAVVLDDADEMLGVNTRHDLEAVERILLARDASTG
ncbi:MAG: NTP transferase domain-containing protein [Thermoanaerobaculales bacterium]|nr:NTP transferase domain-containing protein [Thermoanaerobaculales bacterium]